DPQRSSITVAFPHSSIGLLCQTEQSFEKRIALALEESRICQELSRGRRPRQRYRSGTNDRAERQVRTDELARSWHDQTRGGGWIQVEVRKNQPVATVHRGSIAGFVIPDLEVSHFRAANAGEDAQCQQA